MWLSHHLSRKSDRNVTRPDKNFSILSNGEVLCKALRFGMPRRMNMTNPPGGRFTHMLAPDLTADKVSLRMNALVTYRIADARKAVSSTDDVRQALYRETQLALRAIVGVRELDAFLSDKDVFVITVAIRVAVSFRGKCETVVVCSST